jgi:hypothetical protein
MNNLNRKTMYVRLKLHTGSFYHHTKKEISCVLRRPARSPLPSKHHKKSASLVAQDEQHRQWLKMGKHRRQLKASCTSGDDVVLH